MNAERLLDVATVLEGVPDQRFNLAAWRFHGECGTTCCAVGHYCEARPDSGLKLTEGWTRSTDSLRDAGGAIDWEAASAHFDIADRDASYLFGEWSYPDNPTREMVIDRIRAFVASGGKREDGAK